MYLKLNKRFFLIHLGIHLTLLSLLSLVFKTFSSTWGWYTPSIVSFILFFFLCIFIPILEHFIKTKKNLYFFKFFFFFIVIKALVLFSLMIWFKTLALPDSFYFYILVLYLYFIVAVTYYVYSIKPNHS